MARDPDGIVSDVTCTAFGFSLMAGVGILGWQIYLWLKFGAWVSIPFVVVFEYQTVTEEEVK